MNRRNFLRLGALFVPAAAAIIERRRVYSFIWAPTPDPFRRFREFDEAVRKKSEALANGRAAVASLVKLGWVSQEAADRARIAVGATRGRLEFFP